MINEIITKAVNLAASYYAEWQACSAAHEYFEERIYRDRYEGAFRVVVLLYNSVDANKYELKIEAEIKDAAYDLYGEEIQKTTNPTTRLGKEDGKMTNFETAARLAGLNGKQIAERLGVSTAYISQLMTGKRNLGPNNVQLLADLLDVDQAWLLGVPQTLPLIDPLTGDVFSAGIIRSEDIPEYGTLYHVYLSETGDIVPVILSAGMQLTPTDWTSLTVHSVADIPDGTWMGPGGLDAIMLDGLPRVMFHPV